MRIFLMLCMVLCMVFCIVGIGNAQNAVAVYPATVDSMMKMWALMFDVCSETGVPTHDVHVQDQDASNIVIKMEDKWYIPFLEKCESKLSAKPLVRLDQQGGIATSFAMFEIELNWPDGTPSTIDEELKKLRDDGIKVEKKKMMIYVMSVGKVDLQKVVAYMTKAAEKVNADQAKVPSLTTTQPPAGKPAVVPDATTPAPAEGNK